ncbi:hypothetical protein AJ85_18150 [Alkalihalobacillus alcalophilus ATCC 27647 = CGMCC 1.3604]|uniref:Radical SAM core domain-containing protein n=1 Tax=Alkalihalobacillus alcalophilus ATCC 27647 = CGMCC 1.3604 TaxID=1218173 RepID=A0A094XDD4_ALKAL|nr:radical SAM/CxCxxxxC motif protein YfkAB [Alkalihalobacillus alcalophilus]KGA96770.1 hypothetical protein BALCAV_0214250 [Alkalihalobacillus alcalophilus ATCC 27647 = CGMCC 1.3604]MED1563509.1 radical SAM/CxCxxxxC motif protein YfkAB [Alkalihalobacillus alcalophilus]THG92064.1 hypothetical protein AJ85_18150 [Alkalihalobacillus alcalophilus ATCC 27647 = CGMCC 1.3604]
MTQYKTITKSKQTPVNDAWEAYLDVDKHGKQVLSSVEFTTTNMCNMRCAHCAVGQNLDFKDPEALPLELILQRLDEIPTLRTISITGGEPMMNMKSVKNYVVPILKYAHERGIYTQINSNLTLPLDRYEHVIPYLDVLHISHNWTTVDEFIDVGFAYSKRKPSREQRKALFEGMKSNAKALSERGVIVSAETMLNSRTLPYIESIHKEVVEEMNCARHEIHPMYPSGFLNESNVLKMQDSLPSMYPSDFASALEVASLEDIRTGIHRLLDTRNQDVWMLFGTLPFYPCSDNDDDLKLQKRLFSEKNVTVRNDPDGRSRLNVNIFDGDIIVTDFGDTPPLGNIQTTTLPDAYTTWMESSIAQSLNCHCPSVQCLGPNVLVKDAYYPKIDFTKRSTNI